MNIITKFELHRSVVIKDLQPLMGTVIKIEFSGVLLYNVQYWWNGEQKYAWCFEDDIR
jgi:hypothetical protein